MNNMIKIRIGDTSVCALLDTGSMVNLVSAPLLQKVMPSPYTIQDRPNGKTYYGANLKPLDIKGQVNIALEIDDITTQATFLVTPVLPVPIILGWEWMKANNVSLHPKTSSMKLGDPSVLSILETFEEPEPMVLNLCQDITIPANSLQQCALYVQNKSLNQLVKSTMTFDDDLKQEESDIVEYELYVVPHPSLVSSGVIMCDGLILVSKDGIAHVKLANPTDEPVDLYTNDQIALASPAEHYEIMTADDLHGHIVALIQDTHSDSQEGSVGTQTEVTAPAHYFDSEVFQPNVLRLEERNVEDLEPIDWDSLLSKDVMNDDQRKQMVELLEANRDVFATSVQQVGRVSCVKHEIRLKPEARIIRQRPYRLSPEKQEALDTQVQQLLQAKVIIESDSPWQSPVVMIKKRNKAPDGSDLWRTCIDYRALNAMTLKDTGYFAMPTFDDLYDSISRQRPRWMSSLDMLSGYYQIEMDENSQDYTTFNTGKGSYKFLRCPFGLSLAPFSYSRAMHAALSRLGQTFVWFYLDDVFVASSTFSDHIKHLQRVFNQFRQYGFTVHPHKCSFAQDKLKFLGHIWDSTGIKPDPSKVEIMQDFPAPTNVTEVRRWLGLSGYYRRFITNYSKMAHPLTELTKKDNEFEWTPKCQQAMDEIKKALLNNAVLYYPRLDREFTLNTDASVHSISSILSQKDDDDVLRPVAFFSMKLAPAQQVWDINSKEAFALVMSIRLHRHLIGTNKLTVITDNLTTRYLQTLKRSTSPKLLRWALELQGLNMEIKHAPGRTIQAVDALSRMPSGNDPLADHVNRADLELPLNEEIILNVAADGPRSSISDLVNLFRNQSSHGDLVTDQGVKGTTPKNVQPPTLNDSTDVEVDSDVNENSDDDEPLDENPPMEFAYHKLLMPADGDLIYADFVSHVETMSKQQHDSPDFRHMINYLKFGTLPNKGSLVTLILKDNQNFIIGDDGLLYHLFSPNRRKEEYSYIAQLCLPAEYRGYVVQQYHDNILGAHRGTVRLIAALRQRYFWPKMQADISTYVKTCQACLQGKHPTSKRKAPMELRQVYPIWYHVHMDVVSLPKDPANGYTKCLVMIDSFSSYVELTAITDEQAETVAKAFFRVWVCRHSVPVVITSDRHQSFKSKFMKELTALLGSKHLFTSSNRPQSNSKVERTNGSILNILRVLAAKQRNWCELLPVLRFALNTSENASSKYSPYFLAHGVHKGGRVLVVCTKQAAVGL